MATVRVLYTEKELTTKQIIKYDKQKKNVYRLGMTTPFISKKVINVIQNILLDEFSEEYDKKHAKKVEDKKKGVKV